jgi:hypothetical protein
MIRKKHSSMVCESWFGTRWNRLAMVWERKRWGGVPSYKRAQLCQLINISEPLSLV